MAPRFYSRKHDAVDMKECELYFTLDKARMAALMRNDPPPRISTTIFSNIGRNSIADEWDLIGPATHPQDTMGDGMNEFETFTETSSSAKNTAESSTRCETQCSPSTSPKRATVASPLCELASPPVGSASVVQTDKPNIMPGGWVDDEAMSVAEGAAPPATMSEPGRWSPTTGYGDANSAPMSDRHRSATNVASSTATKTPSGTVTLLSRSARYRDGGQTSITRPGIIFPVSRSSVAYAQMSRGISEVDAHETYGPNGYAAVSAHQVTEGRWIENGKSEHEMGGYKQKKKGMKAVKSWWGDVKSNFIENARTWGVKPST